MTLSRLLGAFRRFGTSYCLNIYGETVHTPVGSIEAPVTRRPTTQRHNRAAPLREPRVLQLVNDGSMCKEQTVIWDSKTIFCPYLYGKIIQRCIKSEKTAVNTTIKLGINLTLKRVDKRVAQLYRQHLKLHCFPAAFHWVLCTAGRRTEQHLNITSKVIAHLQITSVHNNLTIFLHCHSQSIWTNQVRQ
jgi:hypothetical protein